VCCAQYPRHRFELHSVTKKNSGSFNVPQPRKVDAPGQNETMTGICCCAARRLIEVFGP
jgi:hypothetical protein